MVLVGKLPADVKIRKVVLPFPEVIMLFRGSLLALGVIALVAGIWLMVLSLGSPITTAASIQPVERQAVLTAARALPPGTLLRSDDTRWTELPINEIPRGGNVRRPGEEPEILGDATRRAFRAGEVVVADQLIRPTEAGFLPAVLGPGMRAISLAVDAAEAGSGLIAPADHVDVILTQVFNDSSGGAGFRSAGETVLRNLRVIAVDQTTNLAPAKSGDLRLGPAAETRVPKTVTLEVTAHQAEVLTVAHQLGKLQLTLRSLNEAEALVGEGSSDPTWGSEVSRALRYLSREPSPTDSNQASLPAPVAVDIIRGIKTEQRCFRGTNWQSVDCAAAPASGTPAKPGTIAPATVANRG
jgi:pilus assembly protein CpaB